MKSQSYRCACSFIVPHPLHNSSPRLSNEKHKQCLRCHCVHTIHCLWVYVQSGVTWTQVVGPICFWGSVLWSDKEWSTVSQWNIQTKSGGKDRPVDHQHSTTSKLGGELVMNTNVRLCFIWRRFTRQVYELCSEWFWVWEAAVSRSIPRGGGSKTSRRHLTSFTQLYKLLSVCR